MLTFTLVVLSWAAPLAAAPDLGADSWALRESASALLERAEPAVAAGPLRALAAGADCPEVRHRALAALRRAEAVVSVRTQAMLDARYLGCYPCLDAMLYDGSSYLSGLPFGPTTQGYYAAALARPACRRLDYPNYPHWREATRMWVRDRYDAGVPLRLLDAVVFKMYEADVLFLTNNRAAWRAPEWWPLPLPPALPPVPTSTPVEDMIPHGPN